MNALATGHTSARHHIANGCDFVGIGGRCAAGLCSLVLLESSLTQTGKVFMSVFVTPTTFKLNSMSEIIMIDKTDVAG